MRILAVSAAAIMSIMAFYVMEDDDIDDLNGPSSAHVLTYTMRDVDVVVRTVIGEAGNQPVIGKIAVVHVIMNRARQNISWYGGRNLSDVAMHKAKVVRGGTLKTVWQFEPWMTRREYLWSISENSPEYKKVKSLVIGCLEGKHPDPTDGATHFLEPNIVMMRTKGVLPKWAQGNGKRIGDHVFFKPYRPTV